MSSIGAIIEIKYEKLSCSTQLKDAPKLMFYEVPAFRRNMMI